MTSDDITIRVKVDTRQAEAGIKDLERTKDRAQRQRNVAATRKGGRIAAIGVGAVASYRMLSRIAHGANVDMEAEALTTWKARIQQRVDAQLGFSAKAEKTTRMDTKRAFTAAIQDRGGLQKNDRGNLDLRVPLPDYMQSFQTFSRRDHELEEKGRNILHADQRFSIHPGGAAVHGIGGYIRLLVRSAGYVYEELAK